jgi:hypothetical protein
MTEARGDRRPDRMNKNVARGVVTVVLCVAFAVGLLAVVTPTLAASCEQQCMRDYRRCVPICSKNPCLVSCEFVLEICLSNCGVES